MPAKHTIPGIKASAGALDDTKAAKTYQILDKIRQLFKYCQQRDWAGFDPYDALNSQAFASTPFYRSRICRIAVTQLLKRLPINIRPLLFVKPEQNPKSTALFMKAQVRLSYLGILERGDCIEDMLESLVRQRSPNTTYWAWGYSFPWQGRSVLVPRLSPNLVSTSFVADALVDRFEMNGDGQCLSMAVSAADYLVNELYWTRSESVAGFSYPMPHSRNQVHNANFLGAALLCRVYKYTGESRFLDVALRVARYSASQQHEDGSWNYGELSTQGWIDNFHTGYNLCGLRSIARNLNTDEFDDILFRGLRFFKEHFFLSNNAPKYFHNKAFPFDIHSAAQSVITLSDFNDVDGDVEDLAFGVLEWSLKNLWDSRGFFYYRKDRFFTNRIPYMRWSQAWMLLAMTTLLQNSSSRVDLSTMEADNE
jgi:hypothetical protein